MDDISHILWSYLLFSWTGHPWLAAVFGVLPDLISFVPMFFAKLHPKLLKPEFPRLYKTLPAWSRRWAERSYDVTHSLLASAVVTVLAAALGAWWLLAWPLHVLMDIPTHTKQFYPTPILWPFSDWSWDGVTWTDKRVWIPNAILLLAGYAWFFFG